MLIEQGKEVLFPHLDLSGLGWSAKNWATVCVLLAEYLDIFSLKPGELGCTDLVKCEMKVTYGKPFKEQFQRIPSSMIDDMKEELEGNVISPSQSLWCNAVVLECKKDEDLCFSINFHKSNARTKKDSYPLPGIQEVIKSLIGTGYFSCLDLADHNGWDFKAIHHFYCG